MFCFFVFVPSYSQYPDFNPQPNNFIVSPYIVNPSAFREEAAIDFLYKNKTGLLNDLRSIYADFTLPIKNQNLGFKVYSQQETSLFAKTKAHLSYSVKIEFNKELKWVLGSQAGISNIYFGSSGASAGGSDINFDISFASTVYYKQLEWGLMLHQLSNSELKPIDYVFELKPYVESYVLYRFELGPFVNLNAAYKALYQNYLYNDVNLELEHKENKGILVAVKNDFISAGAFFNFYMEQLNNRLYASYSFQTFSDTDRQKNNEFEIGLLITIAP